VGFVDPGQAVLHAGSHLIDHGILVSIRSSVFAMSPAVINWADRTA
jgi:hypothetical protein